MTLIQTKNPREAAYLALLASLREEQFIADALKAWHPQAGPIDYNLAREIAFGAARMALSLDWMAAQYSQHKKLDLKTREKALLRTAVYQLAYMRAPAYAVVNETMEIAKLHCHSTFSRFLNATLRKLAENVPELPQHDLSIRYSYPLFFINELLDQYGFQQTTSLLEAGNKPAPTTFRLRAGKLPAGCEKMQETAAPMGIVREASAIQEIGASSAYYIQNATPVELIQSLSKGIKTSPVAILDLCASPGGKLLAVHDLYPKSALYANDVSEEKLRPLQENCAKYGMQAGLSVSKGEAFLSPQLFDLILLDVPCSNSGVLNKRPEARWRLSEAALKKQEELQLNLLSKAATMLTPNGEIWYLTCSILERENLGLVEKACSALSLSIKYHQTLLPNTAGWDGGFGCALKKP